MFGFNGSTIQGFVRDPEVLKTLIEEHKYNVSDSLQVEPTEADRLMKMGKGPATEKIAPTVTDQKLLTKLSRDNRKGVRSAVLKNPNLTQEQISEVARRSFKHDKDYSVVAKAAKLLTPENLLSLVKDEVQVGSYFVRRAGHSTMTLSHLPFEEVYGSSAHFRGAVYLELLKPLREGGVDYLKQLHDAGIEDYAVHRDRIGMWYEKGMTAWMVPEMKPELAYVWLANILSRDLPLSADDIRAARPVIESVTEEIQIGSYRNTLTAKHDPEVYRNLMDMGGVWVQFVRQSVHAPADLCAQFAEEMPDDAITNYPIPEVPVEVCTWDVSPEALESLNDAETPWIGFEEANVLVDRLLQMALRDGLSNLKRGVRQLNKHIKTTHQVRQIVFAVHPNERHKLSYKAIFLARGRSSYDPQGQTAALTKWAAGEFVDQPSVEKVTNMVAWTVALGFPLNTTTRPIADANRVSLFLGKPLQLLEEVQQTDPKVSYLVAQHYFGNDVSAWQMVADLDKDWDGSLIDLLETVCATCGLDLPTEVVDLADLEETSASDDSLESDDVSDESESNVHSPEVEELEEVPDTTEEVEVEEDKADESEVSDEPVETSEESGSPESETSAGEIIPLELTAPVQFSLF